MRIIQKGLPLSFTKEVICTHCKAILEVVSSDIWYKKSTEPMGSAYVTSTITCPECGVITYLNLDPDQIKIMDSRKSKKNHNDGKGLSE